MSKASRIDRVDRYFGDLLHHDRARISNILFPPLRTESEGELEEVLKEIMAEYNSEECEFDAETI